MGTVLAKLYICPYCGASLFEGEQKLVCPDCSMEFYLYEKVYLSSNAFYDIDSNKNTKDGVQANG